MCFTNSLLLVFGKWGIKKKSYRPCVLIESHSRVGEKERFKMSHLISLTNAGGGREEGRVGEKKEVINEIFP